MSNEKSTPEGGPCFRLEISGGFLLILSLTGFLCGAEAIAAAMLAAAFHELGHLSLILLQGGLPRRLTLDMSGACLHCSGPEPDIRQELFRAMAGPAAGLLLWLALKGAEASFLRTAASMSLMLSLVNLLPAAGLDGRRILDCMTAAAADGTGLPRLNAVLDIASVLLTLTFGALHSPQLLLYGLWLLLRRLGFRLSN